MERDGTPRLAALHSKWWTYQKRMMPHLREVDGSDEVLIEQREPVAASR